VTSSPGEPSTPTRASGRASLVRTVGPGVAGTALAAVASAQTWATATASAPATRTVAAQGTDVAPLALPLSLVALAAWGSVLVLRRRGRRAVALLGLAAALGVVATVALSYDSRTDVARDVLGTATGATVSTTGWPVAAAVGALVAAVAFAVAVRHAPGWPEMSTRYDAPTGRQASGGTAGPAAPAKATGPAQAAEPTDRDLWRAMDEGRDPTV